MVFATAVPSRNAATKLKNAAHSTASLGDSTRVDTTVAILFAASWNPFRKSKVSATRIVTIRSRRSGFTKFSCGRSRENLGVFQDHGFEHVGDVLGFVSRSFQKFDQFLDLDQCDGILFLIEQLPDRGSRNHVR